MGDYTPRRLKIELRNGKELHLEEMNLLDLEDAEAEIGKPRSEWFAGGQATSREITTVLWVCSRGFGLSDEQKAAGQWPFTRRQLALWITPDELVERMGDIEGFFHPAQGTTPDEPGSEPSGNSA